MSCRALGNLGSPVHSRQNDSREIRRNQGERKKTRLAGLPRSAPGQFFSWYKEQRFFVNADGSNAFQLGTESKSTQIHHSLGHRKKAHQHCPERFASPAPARSSVNPPSVTLAETKHGLGSTVGLHVGIECGSSTAKQPRSRIDSEKLLGLWGTTM